MIETQLPERHALRRVQHELVRRTVTVAAVVHLTPKMRRIVFADASLHGFKSLGFDDHVKIFFPVGGASGESVGRDFTPRIVDAESGRLTVDFALHEAGPAASWARHAKPGDTLQLGGPRGSLIVPDDFDWYLLIGDETALPAIGRRLEELRPGVPVTTVVVVSDADEEQRFATAAAWTPVWIHRHAKSPSDEPAVRRVLDGVRFPAGDGHVWLAGESAMIRGLRQYLLNDRRHPADWLRAAGYWKAGEPGTHEKI